MVALRKEVLTSCHDTVLKGTLAMVMDDLHGS
jgi:hypothetical protein